MPVPKKIAALVCGYCLLATRVEELLSKERLGYFLHRPGRPRHPQCQSLARAEWIENRQSELLECAYFHVVFTVPEEIAEIALQNKRTVYGILFRATAETRTTIAADPQHLGAEIGFFAVLHSWGQTLLFHPHLHCVVPGGGLSLDGKTWISCRPRFFLPVDVLSCLFRRLFLKYLQKAFDSGALQFFGSLERLRDPHQFRLYLAPLKNSKWVVYAKPPFGGPQQVLDYVGRYTSRVAISNTACSTSKMSVWVFIGRIIAITVNKRR